MMDLFAELNKKERKTFKRLNTPIKIQNFLERIPKNFEDRGYTIYSPRIVLKKREAHCLEGALFAAAALMFHGKDPILLDLKTTSNDDGHVVALFRENGKWGAISKTNHAVLRYRDPVYKSARELAMSYFNEYFLDSGEKTLRSYAVFNLKKIKKNWVTDRKMLIYVDKAIEKTKHVSLVSGNDLKNLRKADKVEIKAGKLVVWENVNKKTPSIRGFDCNRLPQ